MPEHACELPLWLANWWELGLSRTLLMDLAEWQSAFDAEFDPFRGWSSAAASCRWAAEAENLIARFRRDLPAHIRLHVDLWPLEDSS